MRSVVMINTIRKSNQGEKDLFYLTPEMSSLGEHWHRGQSSNPGTV